MKEKTKKWLVAAGGRAFRTFCQTFAGFLIVGAGIADVDWTTAFSVSFVAAVASFVTSVGVGLPEINGKDEEVDDHE